MLGVALGVAPGAKSLFPFPPFGSLWGAVRGWTIPRTCRVPLHFVWTCLLSFLSSNCILGGLIRPFFLLQDAGLDLTEENRGPEVDGDLTPDEQVGGVGWVWVGGWGGVKKSNKCRTCC